MNNKYLSKRQQLIFDYIMICFFVTLIILIIALDFLPTFSRSIEISSGLDMYNYIMSWEFVWIGIKFVIGFAIGVFSATFIYAFSYNFYLTWTDQLENSSKKRGLKSAR